MKRGGRVSVSGGFCLLLAFLLFFDEGNILPWALLACALHELGHLVVLWLLGGQVAAFRLTVAGAELIPTRARLFSYGEELFLAAGGPMVSLLVATLSILWTKNGGEVGALFAGLNLVAGLFNLLPVGPLDGGRMLRIILLQGRHPWIAEGCCRALTLALSMALLFVGVWQLLHFGKNPTLLLSGLWLLLGVQE